MDLFMSPWAGALELQLCRWNTGFCAKPTTGSRPSAVDATCVLIGCCLWFILRELIPTCLDHNIPYSSQGFSTAFGKPASKFWTSQYTASCLDVLAMLASMVGFLCRSFIHLRPLGWIGCSNHQQFKETAEGLVARLSSNVDVSTSTAWPRTQNSIL